MKSGPLEAGEGYKGAESITPPTQGVNRRIAILFLLENIFRCKQILDLILRIVAVIGTLGSAVAMGTTDETLPFFTQFTQFKAEYNDLPSLTFFVIASSIVCAYLAFSLPISIFHILKSGATISRLILIIFNTAMLALLAAGGSAATAIVYLAHKGNSIANWFAICQQFNSFCKRISGYLIGSFGAVIVFILLILFLSISISRRS